VILVTGQAKSLIRDDVDDNESCIASKIVKIYFMAFLYTHFQLSGIFRGKEPTGAKNR
jgi:hypothetical protein